MQSKKGSAEIYSTENNCHVNGLKKIHSQRRVVYYIIDSMTSIYVICGINYEGQNDFHHIRIEVSF